MADLNAATDDQLVAVLDVETTGLFPRSDRVCEVGIVLGKGDEVLDTYQTLVNPLRPISLGAARVNGLSDLDVCDAPTFGEIAGEVLARVDGRLLVCHNAPFDLSFLKAEFYRAGLSWQPAGVIDTLEIARRRFRFASNSLEALTARLGIRNPQAHRALGDALATFQVLRMLYRQLPGGARLESFASSYSPAASFETEADLPPELQQALSNGGTALITYEDAQGERTFRRISPRGVATQNGITYLVAFCHLRQEERLFRLDRIVEIEIEAG
ncbi:MAG: hypothetical protein B6D39_00350 [Anaerolineae bacterium UTCFX2]|jgi:DNA polymerase-3 subunit epsilon|nr:exonuclease domain-containing protein [Anaerolineales bacterium]OQY95034.1 MAG: hypothetical protein B6D39_00350 [Anaerolineae bacterium UTCFX2]